MITYGLATTGIRVFNMAGSDIASKVKAGLAKAQAAVSDGGNLVEIGEEIITKDPINGDLKTVTWTTLTNAIFKSYNKGYIDGTTILAGDRELVVDGDIILKRGLRVRAYGKEYQIQNVDFKAPSEVVLAQIAQCREV